MPENFYTVITDLGKSKITQKSILGSMLKLTKLKVGDGNGSSYNPKESQVELKNKVWDGNISSISLDEKNPNWIVVEGIIPNADGGFTIREVGVFDDEDNLIAIGKYPETYKPVFNEGSTKDLLIRMILEVSNSNCVSLEIDPNIVLATKKDIEVLDNKIKNIKVPVASVNSKTGDIELAAEDIKCNDGKTIESSLDDMGYYKKKSKNISSTNLDTLFVSGNYVGQSLINAPTNEWFRVEVFATDTGKEWCKQRVSKFYDEKETFERVFSNETKAWTPWFSLFQYANDIKSKWNNVLGVNLTSTTPSDEYKNHTQWCKNKLVGNLEQKGVVANSNDSLSNLVDKVAYVETDIKITKKFDDIPSQSSGYLAKSIEGFTKDYIYRACAVNKQYVGKYVAFDKTDLNGTLISSGSFDLNRLSFINYMNDRHYNYESTNQDTYIVHEYDNNNTRLKSVTIPTYEGRYSSKPRYCYKDKILMTSYSNDISNYYFYNFNGTKLSSSDSSPDFERIIFTAAVPSGRVIMYTNPNSSYHDANSFDFENNRVSIEQPTMKDGNPTSIMSYMLLAPFLY